MSLSEQRIPYSSVSPTLEVAVLPASPSIHAYRLHDFSRATIDAWVTQMLAHITTWKQQATDPWLALHDLREVSNLSSITPYARARFVEVARQHPDLAGRVCFVLVMPRFLASIGKHVTYNFVHQNQPFITPLICEQVDEGLAWLVEENVV